MKHALLLGVAAAALAAGSVASAQRPPSDVVITERPSQGAGVGTAQNRNGQPQQSFNDVLAGDVAAGRLSQTQADDLAARAQTVRETTERQARQMGQRIRGTMEANRLAVEQNAVDLRSGPQGAQGQAAVGLAEQGLGLVGQGVGEAQTLSQDLFRGVNDVMQRRAQMIAANPNVPESERRQITREAEQINRALTERAPAVLDQLQADIARTRSAVANNRDQLAARAQDMIDRYGPDPRNWPQPPPPGQRPPAPPSPPPPWANQPPPPPPPPAPTRTTPSGPPRRGTIPTTADDDPAFRARPAQNPNPDPTPTGRTDNQRNQQGGQQGQQGGTQRNRPPPPPPPPPPRTDPTRIPPTRLPDQTAPVEPGRPGRLPAYDPNRPPPALGLPRPGGGGPRAIDDSFIGPRAPGTVRPGSGDRQVPGGTQPLRPEDIFLRYRAPPGNAFVGGEHDWLGEAAGGGEWSVGDSLAWADFLARARLRPPGGNESWRGFERGLPTTVAELEAIYEGWDINTAPPGSSGRSFSAAGTSLPMDWRLPASGPLSDELAFYDAMNWLYRSASEGGPWIEWGQLDLANVAVRVNGNGQPMPGSLAEFLRDNYYVNFPAFWDGALYVDLWQYDPIADRDRELARALYGPLWSDRPYRLTFDPTGRLGQFSPDSILAGFLSDLTFDELLVTLLREGIGGLDRLRAQPFNVLLTWGAGAFDVDLHMTGPTGLPDNSRFHIFYAATGALDRPPFAQLIRDCICRSGSEVILTTQLLQGGVYRISAFNFGNQSTSSTELSTNADLRLLIVRGGAAVSVGNGTTIQGGTVVFQGAPTPGRPGNTWVGVEIDPRTGQIRFVNRSDNSVNGDGTGAAAQQSAAQQSLPRASDPAAILPRVPGRQQSGPIQ